MTTPAPVESKSVAEMIRAYFRDFRVLKETRAEFWGIQVVNFLDCTWYFAMLTVASLFFSEDLGMDDKHAGYCIAWFTSATSLMLLVAGACTDWLGIRKSLNLSMLAMLGLRLAMVFVGLTPGLPHRGWWAWGLMLAMAPFMAGIQTMFQSSCQRYTTKRSRSAGFNLWYLFMNIGAAAGGGMVDFFRIYLKNHFGLQHPNVHIFTLGVVTAVLCLIVSATMVRTDAQLVSPDETPEEAKEDAKVEHKKPWQTFQEVVRQPALWRLLVLVALILGVRAVYAYLYLLMPKYWERTIGPDAAIGTLNMINPIGIVIGLILFIPIAHRFKVFNMLVYGAIISSLSLFPMAVPWHWYGLEFVTAHYVMAVLCMVIVTIGEITWSPKLNEYTAAIAPKGQEGIYLGFSLLPWFLAKTVVSSLSGAMLQRWSPETVSGASTHFVPVPLQTAMMHGQVAYWDSPAAMWLLLGGYALAGCLVALWLRNWLTRGANWQVGHK